MTRLKLSSLGLLTLLVACGEKEAPAPAPAPKVQQESSVDALLGGGNPAPKPAAPNPATSTPTSTPNAAPKPPVARAADDIVPRPGEGAYERNLAWLQRLKSATPAQKQAIKLEIDGASLTAKEREAFEKMRLHYNVTY